MLATLSFTKSILLASAPPQNRMLPLQSHMCYSDASDEVDGSRKVHRLESLEDFVGVISKRHTYLSAERDQPVLNRVRKSKE